MKWFVGGRRTGGIAITTVDIQTTVFLMTLLGLVQGMHTKRDTTITW